MVVYIHTPIREKPNLMLRVVVEVVPVDTWLDSPRPFGVRYQATEWVEIIFSVYLPRAAVPMPRGGGGGGGNVSTPCFQLCMSPAVQAVEDENEHKQTHSELGNKHQKPGGRQSRRTFRKFKQVQRGRRGCYFNSY